MLDFSSVYHILLVIFFSATVILHTLAVFAKWNLSLVFIPINVIVHIAVFTFIFLGRLELDFAVLVFMTSVTVYVAEYAAYLWWQVRTAKKDKGGEISDV